MAYLTYKNNPLWERKFDISLINALVPEHSVGTATQIGFKILSADRIEFSLHHLYGGKYQEKTCTIFCLFAGPNIVITKVTTPPSKSDMRWRNRQLVGRATQWAPHIKEAR